MVMVILIVLIELKKILENNQLSGSCSAISTPVTYREQLSRQLRCGESLMARTSYHRENGPEGKCSKYLYLGSSARLLYFVAFFLLSSALIGDSAWLLLIVKINQCHLFLDHAVVTRA